MRDGRNYESCSDERLAEIIFTEGDLEAFNREYWHPELRKYTKFRHERVLNSLTQGTRHHLKGNFSDMEFSEGDDNMWYNSYDCTHHQKSEEMYAMFVEEVRRHVKNNLLPKFQSVEDMQFLKLLVSSWTAFKDTIHVFSELFKHLTLWIEDVPEDEIPKDGIEKIGLNAFKNGIVLEKNTFKKLTLILRNLTERKSIDAAKETIKLVSKTLHEIECHNEVFEESQVDSVSFDFL